MKAEIIEISEEAIDDITKAFLWYEKQLQGLGFDFIKFFDEDLNRITSFAEGFPVAYKELRKCVMEKFPYVIYYKTYKRRSQIKIIRVLHSKRERKRHLR
jgi:plasmid stabilization system protein ParE